MNERHGNLDVLREVDPHWYKLAAILTYKLLASQGADVRSKVTITDRDIAAFYDLFGAETKADARLMPSIVYHPRGDTITIQLLPYAEAEQLGA